MILQQAKRCEPGKGQTSETGRCGNWWTVQDVLPPVAPTTHVSGDAENVEADACQPYRGSQAQPQSGEPAVLPTRNHSGVGEQTRRNRRNRHGDEHRGVVERAAEM